jgi:hypothetical protein
VNYISHTLVFAFQDKNILWCGTNDANTVVVKLLEDDQAKLIEPAGRPHRRKQLLSPQVGDQLQCESMNV